MTSTLFCRATRIMSAEVLKTQRVPRQVPLPDQIGEISRLHLQATADPSPVIF